ncbi:aminopeptidase N [Allobranchiibius huperziae]|uniref:Aminopeptidase N n=1 Tax=Allobranchiibius huperziae TaxID=1874116 RepID=A0A853DEA5_9MICO|nr:aminopeptidase N [Allobranchiibius huperziae]NYJ75782.1 aminopeptidase N [Allobranchiibius huperziae]
MAILQRTEAEARAALIEVTSYDVDLDLDRGDTEFGSVTTIRFSARQPGESTFLDLKAARVGSITLNGTAVDPAAIDDGRVALTDLAADNEVHVAATMSYSRDGEGLHRAVDPEDGKAYVYGMSFMDAAPRMYACFDQPDLKAPYDVRVRAPQDWVVAGNGDATRTAPGEWTLATTKPIATYFFTVCAGPYATVTDEHDGIHLEVHVRAALAKELDEQAPDIFQVTKQSFDHYHRLFGVRYPWGDYHQFFVPEFNAGAMENPGCVTFRDTMIMRGTLAPDHLLSRANTIAHEMAHMWFGDLVTLRWWDDLWLNESFAEYMAGRAVEEATDHDESRIAFSAQRKTWGYAADRAPSTHPIAGSPAPDALSALTNFDGISYAKGASALAQLVLYVGDDAFVAGVRDYLSRHAFGNATLADFLGAMEKASGRDLTQWSEQWLRTSGADVLQVHTETDGDTVADAELRRTPPAGHPADRPHVLDVAGYTDGAQIWRTQVEAAADVTPLGELTGREVPQILLPNASDETWAQVALDTSSLEALRTGLRTLPDSGTRAAAWSALLNGMLTGGVDPRLVRDSVLDFWPAETSFTLLAYVASQSRGALLGGYLPPDESTAAAEAFDDAARTMLAADDVSLPAGIAAATMVAHTTHDEATLRDWADGRHTPAALEGDPDFRWLAIRRLCTLGALTAADVDSHLAQDRSMSAALDGLTAKASIPTQDSKEWAWHQVFGGQQLSNYEAGAVLGGIFRPSQIDLVRPYVARYFAQVGSLAQTFGGMPAEQLTRAGFPHVVVEPATLEAARAAIDGEGLSAGIRRALIDQTAALEERITSRRRYFPDSL